jgi:hypothetical protein
MRKRIVEADNKETKVIQSHVFVEQNSMCHQHQKLRVIRQVLDERLAAWPTVESIVSKDFLRIATSDIQQAIVAKCHSSGTIKAGVLWLDKQARRVLLKMMSQKRPIN